MIRNCIISNHVNNSHYLLYHDYISGCMQEVRRKTTCENNHLIQYTENWQLTTNGFCEQYVTRRDVTGLAISRKYFFLKLSCTYI